MKPLFVLGLGAQKAGTSWLHQILSTQDNANFGFMKEYHIWDYVFSDLCKGFKAPKKKSDNAGAAMRRMMQESPEAYIKYFQGLISSDKNLTGDITPSYSVIDEFGLKKISRLIKGAGFDLKVVFLMRDPVERIWSAVRMEKRNLLRQGKILDDNFTELRVKEYVCLKAQIARSDYKQTVHNITNAFSEHEVHFELYERLFEKTAIYKLQEFLNFELKNIDFSKRVNKSESEQMSEATREMLREYLAPQYDFCNDRFEETKEAWSGFG